MRSRHPRTAALLVSMGVVLLVAVVAGQQIGERTIFGATERRIVIPQLAISPVPDETGTDEAISRNWQRLQVVSVATDPAFPDPRVTPPPPPPTPKLTSSPRPPPPAPASPGYTSPPLPLPIVSHDPDDTPTP